MEVSCDMSVCTAFDRKLGVEIAEALKRLGIKYVMRAGYKDYQGQDSQQSEITDLKKAARYIEMRINLLKGNNANDI